MEYTKLYINETTIDGKTRCQRYAKREKDKGGWREGQTGCSMNGYYNFDAFVRGIKLPFSTYSDGDTKGT